MHPAPFLLLTSLLQAGAPPCSPRDCRPADRPPPFSAALKSQNRLGPAIGLVPFSDAIQSREAVAFFDYLADQNRRRRATAEEQANLTQACDSQPEAQPQPLRPQPQDESQQHSTSAPPKTALPSQPGNPARLGQLIDVMA